MSREVIWAPWRIQYILESKDKSRESSDCFICDGWKSQDDRAHWVVARNECSLVVMNRYPYNNGHLLIAPAAHKGDLEELNDSEQLELMATIRIMKQRLDGIMQPHGYNIGLNLGRAAGAGLPGHLHWHIVPRWNGDTNFMSVTDDTRVIVQSLEALYDQLRSETDD